GDVSQAGSVAIAYTGTATNGTDYTPSVATGSTVNFAAGASTATVTVTTTPDAVVEPDETVIATISGVVGGGTIGASATATGTITNDDTAPVTPPPTTQPPTTQPPLTNGTPGNDTLAAGNSTTPVFGGGGADQITATPDAGSTAQLYGGSGFADPNDAGDTISVSGAGSAIIFGNGGDDVIVFNSTGTASIFGGVGNDQVIITNNSANQITAGPGDDAIQINGNGNNLVLGGSTITDPNDGADRITIVGNGNNVVYANGGDDVIVFTGTGANTVFGGVGNDNITGGSGADRIIAGPGSNVITGGAGADRFVHSVGGQDIITDFNFAAGDRIELGGQPYAFTQTSDGNTAILIGQGGVIVLQGITPGTLTADIFA
ncbi:calcium-binding protein, partial [Aureimonas pseudogalii]